jgi:hypothetical protein
MFRAQRLWVSFISVPSFSGSVLRPVATCRIIFLFEPLTCILAYLASRLCHIDHECNLSYRINMGKSYLEVPAHHPPNERFARSRRKRCNNNISSQSISLHKLNILIGLQYQSWIMVGECGVFGKFAILVFRTLQRYMNTPPIAESLKLESQKVIQISKASFLI